MTVSQALSRERIKKWTNDLLYLWRGMYLTLRTIQSHLFSRSVIDNDNEPKSVFDSIISVADTALFYSTGEELRMLAIKTNSHVMTTRSRRKKDDVEINWQNEYLGLLMKAPLWLENHEALSHLRTLYRDIALLRSYLSEMYTTITAERAMMVSRRPRWILEPQKYRWLYSSSDRMYIPKNYDQSTSSFAKRFAKAMCSEICAPQESVDLNWSLEENGGIPRPNLQEKSRSYHAEEAVNQCLMNARRRTAIILQDLSCSDEGDVVATLPATVQGVTQYYNSQHQSSVQKIIMNAPKVYRARNPVKKVTRPIQLSDYTPEMLEPEMWQGGSVEAPMALAYHLLHGHGPPNFVNTLENNGVNSTFKFPPVRGVYYVSGSSMWFAEWHSAEKLRCRKRFSVAIHGQVEARFKAIENRALADILKSRVLYEQSLSYEQQANAQQNNENENKTETQPSRCETEAKEQTGSKETKEQPISPSLYH